MKTILCFIIGTFVQIGCSSLTEKSTPKKENKMQPSSSNVTPFTCKLTTPALQKRKEEIIAQIKRLIIRKLELPNGFRYYFDGSDSTCEKITAFVLSERACCGFFNFKITISNTDQTILDITGDSGVKAFIESELEM